MIAALLSFIAGALCALMVCIYSLRFITDDMEEEIDFLHEWIEEVESDRDLATQKALQVDAELRHLKAKAA